MNIPFGRPTRWTTFLAVLTFGTSVAAAGEGLPVRSDAGAALQKIGISKGVCVVLGLPKRGAADAAQTKYGGGPGPVKM